MLTLSVLIGAIIAEDQGVPSKLHTHNTRDCWSDSGRRNNCGTVVSSSQTVPQKVFFIISLILVSLAYRFSVNHCRGDHYLELTRLLIIFLLRESY